MAAHEAILELKDRMSKSIIGQEAVVERLLLVLLANGNLLLEGLPGLAKTSFATGIANPCRARPVEREQGLYTGSCPQAPSSSKLVRDL